MATADKARYYLERYVPELQEYQRKAIFSRDEITAITKKRSDFEHILNARGSKPGDYARYATYEMILDALRKKRCKRLGVKSTVFSGQRTVFFILDRATKKFPGDMGLWMQLVHYCQKEKANKKLAKAFTAVLRLKPREWGLWVLAAKHYAEAQGDMSTARSYLQRGLRFCRDDRRLYLEYAKLEMGYLAKLAARRKILGLDEEETENTASDAMDDDNTITLPAITAADINPEASKGVEEMDANAMKRLDSAPAFTGDIVIAIFDAAMTQFANDSDVAESFFDLVASFDHVPATRRILQHILTHIQSAAPESPEAIICEVRLQLFSIDALSAEFPAALGSSLAAVKRGINRLSETQQVILAEKTVIVLLPLLKQRHEMDQGVRKVLEASVKRYLALEKSKRPAKISKKSADRVESLRHKLKDEGRLTELEILDELTDAVDLELG